MEGDSNNPTTSNEPNTYSNGKIDVNHKECNDRDKLLQRLLEVRNFTYDDLFVACEAGLDIVVQKCMRDKLNETIERSKESKMFEEPTPLYIAIKNNHENVCKLLLSNHQTLKYLNNNDSVLHVAVKNNNANIVQLLLDKKINVNTLDKEHTPLMVAVKNNNLAITKLLLQDCRTNINFHCNKETPLECAIVDGYDDMARLLLDHGAKIPSKLNDDGFNTLHEACKRGLIRTVEYLLQKKWFDVDVRSAKRLTALHLAVENDRVDVVRLLVAHGADVNAENVNRSRPLHFVPKCYSTTKLNAVAITKILIEAGAGIETVNAYDYTPLKMALRGKEFEVAQILVDCGADVNRIYDSTHYARWRLGGTLLHWAARGYDRDEACKFLIRNKCDINATECDGRTALCLAAKHNCSEDLARFFIENGACLGNLGGGAPVYWSLYVRNFKMVKFFIENMTDVNVDVDSWDKKRSVLHLTDDPEVLGLLISKGADVMAADVDGCTALHSCGNFKKMQILLENGANVHALNHKKRTPLFYAKTLYIAELLCEYGADVNARDYKNASPIMFAENVQIAQFLFENGASVHKTDKDETPLHTIFKKYDCFNDNNAIPPLIDFFVNKSVDVNAQDKDGNTLLHICQIHSLRTPAEYVLELGGRLDIKNNDGQTPEECSGWILTDLINKFEKETKNVVSKASRIVHLSNAAFQMQHPDVKKTLLHMLVERKCDRNMEFLLDNHKQHHPRRGKRKLNVNVYDECFDTPLHYAVRLNSERLVTILLKNGAIYNSKNCDGKMPVDFAQGSVKELLERVTRLYEAIEAENFDVITELITQSPCVINAKNHKNTYTPLMWCVTKRFDVDKIKWMLNNGADPFDYVPGKKTVLHEAIERCSIDVIEEILVSAEKLNPNLFFAFVNAQNRDETALKMAVKMDDYERVKLLVKYGACWGKIESPAGSIRELLTTIDELFRLAKRGDSVIVEKLRGLSLSAEDCLLLVNARDRVGNDIVKALNECGHGDLAGQVERILKISRVGGKIKDLNADDQADEGSTDEDMGFGLFD